MISVASQQDGTAALSRRAPASSSREREYHADGVVARGALDVRGTTVRHCANVGLGRAPAGVGRPGAAPPAAARASREATVADPAATGGPTRVERAAAGVRRRGPRSARRERRRPVACRARRVLVAASAATLGCAGVRMLAADILVLLGVPLRRLRRRRTALGTRTRSASPTTGVKLQPADYGCSRVPAHAQKTDGARPGSRAKVRYRRGERDPTGELIKTKVPAR